MGGQGELPEEVTFNAMISQLKSPQRTTSQMQNKKLECGIGSQELIKIKCPVGKWALN